MPSRQRSSKDNSLDLFHPAVSGWFRRTLGDPTPPQELGWPHISAGRSCLICAPTGSGKTLAAFLAGIDSLFRANLEARKTKGVQILYISPLKALNYDIERNLRAPLEGVSAEGRRLGVEGPDISVGVRTGDTPSRERLKMARRPPQILITTPESLNLILSSRAASILAGVRQVIVDEVHSLVANKRGAFLSVLLESLESIVTASPARTGLSATQRPLEEVARFLGGYDSSGKPRPVEIVDASELKKLDLTVTSATADLYAMQAGELWPQLEEKILSDIQSHRSTLVFANNRRTVERLTLDLNSRAQSHLVEPHHGSISPTRRKETEERLKNGDLRGVVATSTLELGIDMGAIDLVCQIQSPKTVAGALQRVGRAGHLYGETSRGKIYATSVTDLLESAVISRSMRFGRVEATRAVSCPLDVLAQQIVAMCVHGPIEISRVLATVRRSACFADLSEQAFWRTVEMVSGRLGKDFAPRVSLDRVNSQLLPLPGTLRAVIGGSVIPDTGQFPVYLSGTRLSIGELDEEFVFEAREGEAFRLGTSLWRIEKIEADRIFVHPTSGVSAKTPFWRGEMRWRDSELGQDIGTFLNKVDQITAPPDLVRFITTETACDETAANNLAEMIRRQKAHGALPTDRRIVVEHFHDQLGEGRLAVITPFGGRIHQTLRIALTELVRDEMSAMPESFATDDGVLVRLPRDAPDPAALVRRLTPERFRALLDRGIVQSPLFGLLFRQNAARAMLLPGARPGKRNPLWLQRLKSKDVLQAARSVPDFPIVIETMRECRSDYLDENATAQLLRQVQTGDVELAVSSSPLPSPFAAALEFGFNSEFMYVWDRPVGRAAEVAEPSEIGMAALISSSERAISPEALRRLSEDASPAGSFGKARTAPELAEVLRSAGDLSTAEMAECSENGTTALLDELLRGGVLREISVGAEKRWVLSEEASQWRKALSSPAENEPFWREKAADYLRNRPGCHPEDFAERYGLDSGMGHRAFQEMEGAGAAVNLGFGWLRSDELEAARRITLAMRRQEAHPVSLARYQQFLFEWQRLSTSCRLEGQDGLLELLEMFTGFAAPAQVWEAEIFARRLKMYSSAWLDGVLAGGQTVWRGVPDTGRPSHLFFAPRALSHSLPLPESSPPADKLARRVVEALQTRGASFLVDLGLALSEDTRRIEKTLYDLSWSGHVRQDGFGPIRAGSPIGSAQEAAAKSHGSAHQRLRQLKRYRPKITPQSLGRWELTNGNAILDEETLELAARILLDRYGVLTRDIARSGGFEIPWGSLYRVLERMELSGEIERGWYIRDMGGAQFALPEAAQTLRQPGPDSREAILVHTCDPALVGSAGWVRRVGNWVVFDSGEAVLLVEAGARRLTPLASDARALSVFPLLRHLFDSPWPLRPIRRLTVDFWGARPVMDSSVEMALRDSGFESTPRGLVLSNV